jgi:ArsR family transcriptional regulator
MALDDLPESLKALSDETRLRIFALLLERECCVCEVMQALDISQTRASRNLGILENVGFLKSRRDGKWMHYSLRDDAKKHRLNLLTEIVRDFLRTNAKCRQDRERLKKAVKMGNACISAKKIRK